MIVNGSGRFTSREVQKLCRIGVARRIILSLYLAVENDFWNYRKREIPSRTSRSLRFLKGLPIALLLLPCAKIPFPEYRRNRIASRFQMYVLMFSNSAIFNEGPVLTIGESQETCGLWAASAWSQLYIENRAWCHKQKNEHVLQADTFCYSNSTKS